ncbi:hypothetical protein J5N97_003062 [Dioscorea zingiberensis]|uniref:Uncharacterized protein n=1 Tax=Dioscorea zingiberensis TaxID=325984 RepID=A0A9D5HQ84_9LILI|nr:hypothetical protein J5N97_003062 [Dioscorea zingiberensis]
MDLASLFATRRGVEATIVLTPANAALIRPTLQRSTTSDHPVELLLYPFPSEAAGLPSGVENLATVSSEDDSKFTQAVVSSREAHDRLLPAPPAVVATDFHFGGSRHRRAYRHTIYMLPGHRRILRESSWTSSVRPSKEEGASKLRVFFIPFFATGHIIPAMDLASLFAARHGVEATIVLTPANAAVIRPTLQRSTTSGHPVELLLYPFPSEAAGLPSGVENLATVSSDDDSKFTQAVVSSREAHDRLLRKHHPDAVVTDVHFWWITGIAADIGIPSICFHVIGARILQSHHEPALGDQGA